MGLSDAEVERYARHLILDEIGDEGQERLLRAKVLVVGAGGLGSPVLLYLAAAGVGTITVADGDRVDLSNLQRQIAHGMASLGQPKVESAAAAMAAINPDIRVEQHAVHLEGQELFHLVGRNDLVVDATDSFGTRDFLNRACLQWRRPLVSAAILRFDGQVTVFKGYLPDQPCLRCLHREPPGSGPLTRCEEAGILGATAGVVGTLQATEVIKELLGLGDSLAGTLLLYDALGARFHRVRVPKDPLCPACGSGTAADHASVSAEPLPA